MNALFLKLQRACGRNHSGLFGIVSVWIVLLCGIRLASTLYFVGCEGSRVSAPASIFALLPDAIRESRALYEALRWVFYAAAVAWMTRLFLPWSAILAAGSFLLFGALNFENTDSPDHTYHLVTLLMILNASWFWFRRREIGEAGNLREFCFRRIYPRWVFLAAIYTIGLSYAFAGLSKLETSGLDWVNGTSLQLWTVLFGDRALFLTQLIIADRGFALALQAATLVIECSAILGLPFALLRLPIGVALIALHLGIIGVFGWEFHHNMILIALYYLPCLTLSRRMVVRWKNG